MRMERVIVQLPTPLKARLDALRTEGTTNSGFIRWLLEEHFKQAQGTERKGR